MSAQACCSGGVGADDGLPVYRSACKSLGALVRACSHRLASGASSALPACHSARDAPAPPHTTPADEAEFLEQFGDERTGMTPDQVRALQASTLSPVLALSLQLAAAVLSQPDCLPSQSTRLQHVYVYSK